MLLGLAWSVDRAWGLHVLGRQWYWLLPPLLMQTLRNAPWRKRFLALLSFGLVAHLAFCVLPMKGYVIGTISGGSGIHDATGHIGHIGFGVVYGMWAGFMLHWGWQRTGGWRALAWLLAAWAWVMVFLAQGRSGYLVSLVIFLVISWRHAFSGHGIRRTGFAVVFVLLTAGMLVMGPGKARMLETWQGSQAAMHGDFRHAAGPAGRILLWLGAWQAWKQRPLLGAGTGGFPAAASQVAKKFPDLNYHNINGLAVHPHNMYLLALVRWGVPGIMALGFLFFFWIRTGWRSDWSMADAGALIALPGIALAVHGLSAPSLEEHFEDILAVLLLGCGLALHSREKSGGSA